MTSILIADDRNEAVIGLEARLQSKGFSVFSVSNGKEALEIFEQESIDLAIIDMNMPEMDGCQATELLKGNIKTQLVPVILCTAHPLPGDEARARESGCDGFLSKPIDFQELLTLLSQFLSHGHLNAEETQH